MDIQSVLYYMYDDRIPMPTLAYCYTDEYMVHMLPRLLDNVYAINMKKFIKHKWAREASSGIIMDDDSDRFVVDVVGLEVGQFVDMHQPANPANDDRSWEHKNHPWIGNHR